MEQRYWLGALALAVAGPVFAALPTASPQAFAALDDQALSQLRGRYLSAGEVLHFGVQLATVWTRPDGSRVGGAVALDVGADRRTTITRYQLNDASGLAASSLPAGSTVDVNGVAQVNQIAGSGNLANNATQIYVTEGNLQAASLVAEGWQLVPTLVPESGGALALTVHGGLASVASQSIGAGKLSQMTVIKGNGMQVSNAMQVIVGLKPGAISRSAVDNWIPSLTQGMR